MITILIILELLAGFVVFYTFYLGPKLNPFNRGKKFLDEGKINEAIIEFTKVIEKEPNNYIAHYNLANLYLKQNVLLKAEEHFNKVLEIGKFTEDITRLNILQQLVIIKYDLKRYEEAYFTAKEILEITSADFIANYYIGLIFAGQKFYDEAIKYFKMASKSRPNDINSKINLGLCYTQICEINLAIEEFDNARKIAPENEKILLFLGIAFFISESYKIAIQYILKILKTSNDIKIKFLCYRLLGFSFFKLDDINEIEKILDEAIQFFKSNNSNEEYKQILYDYGMIYLSKGNLINANEKFKILKELQNDYDEIDKIINYIELKTAIKEEKTEEAEEYFTPAVASYYKASKHIVENEEEVKSEEKIEKEIEFIKKDWINSFDMTEKLWELGGLTSDKRFNIEPLLEKEKLDNMKEKAESFDFQPIIKKFIELDRAKFQEIGRKIVEKLGLKIIKENFKPSLVDFVEGDGIDYVTKEINKNGSSKIILVQLRRWNQGKVGEIPFRNMTQSMAEFKASKGIFIVPASLTEGAKKFVESMKNISVLAKIELTKLLRGLL